MVYTTICNAWDVLFNEPTFLQSPGYSPWSVQKGSFSRGTLKSLITSFSQPLTYYHQIKLMEWTFFGIQNRRPIEFWTFNGLDLADTDQTEWKIREEKAKRQKQNVGFVADFYSTMCIAYVREKRSIFSFSKLLSMPDFVNDLFSWLNPFCHTESAHSNL